MNAENAEIFIEGGQTPQVMTALTDNGDHIVFNSSGELWSRKSGFEADVKPNGLATGGKVTAAASGTNDLIDVASMYVYLAGVKTLVSAATDETITRATPTDTHLISSVTITDAGAIAILAGADGTSFSETRGANGGPPWIPTGSVEIAQVRLSSSIAAAIVADDIYDTVNTHTERYAYPVWEDKIVRVEDRIIGLAGVDFSSALPLIHSDDAGSTTVGKKVFASWYEPDFVKVPISSDFVLPETSHSTSSKQVYQKTLGSTSSSIGQGSFTAIMNDGISDHIIGLKDGTLWFKFKQDELKDPYLLANGKFGMARTYPAGDDISAACTISPTEAGVEVIS